MDFALILQAMQTCSQAARAVYDSLRRSSKPVISGLMMTVSSPVDRYCFRIPMGADSPFTHLSVSVPPDAMGNRGPPQDASSVPECIETALVGPDGDLVYIDGLRYDDIRRFYGRESFQDAIPDLEKEILRLLPYAQGKKEIPEEYPESESEEEIEEGEPMDVDP